MLAVGEIRHSSRCQSRQRAHWQVSIWVGTAPCTSPEKYLWGMEGGRQSCGSGNTPQTKSTGISPARPQETQQNIKASHEIFWTTHSKGPGFPRWFTVKHRANTQANNGVAKKTLAQVNQPITTLEKVLGMTCEKLTGAPCLLILLCETFPKQQWPSLSHVYRVFIDQQSSMN